MRPRPVVLTICSPGRKPDRACARLPLRRFVRLAPNVTRASLAALDICPGQETGKDIMSGRTRKWLAIFTVMLTLAALAALVVPARDGGSDDRAAHAFVVTPGR